MSNAAIKEIEINCYPYNFLSIQIILIAGVGNRSIAGIYLVDLSSESSRVLNLDQNIMRPKTSEKYN